jgi:hypothetical protein
MNSFNYLDIDVLTTTQITQIKELLDSLDTAHYCFLFLLAEYLSNVKKQSAKNLMNIMNIKRYQ